MRDTTTVIVGAGHCGLAMSRCLAARSVDHVVLERAEVANSWRTQRWDSLRLLTPNWMTRLPGYGYRGADPDVRNGFSGVSVGYQIDADATAEEIRALVAQSQKRSAVYDIVTNPTSVTVDVA